MYILAIACKGKEFLYDAASAHEVSKNSAEKIKNLLNKLNYKITGDGKIWHTYEVDQYDKAYDYACYQRFTIRKGIVKEKFGEKF